MGGNKNKRCWRKGKESEEGNEGTRVRVKRGGGGLHARISFFIIIFLLKTGNGCDV